MKRFIKLSAFLILSTVGYTAKCQQQIVAPPTVTWANDTAWYVNEYFFAAKDSLYDLTLEFGTNSTYPYARVIWGDGKYSDRWATSSPKSLSHIYKEGLFPMEIWLYSSASDTAYSNGPPVNVSNKIVFNRYLDADFKLSGKNLGGCIPIDQKFDTIFFELKDYYNPPGTRYFNGVSVTYNNRKLIYEKEWRLDSVAPGEALLIFSHPSGVLHNYEVWLNLELGEEGDDLYLTRNVGMKPFRLFKSPDLREIFGFQDTLGVEDSSGEVTTTDNFKICAPSPPKEFGFNPLVEMYYQTSPNNPSYLNRRNMRVDYYYTDDTTSSGTWMSVGSDTNYVDSTIMEFRKPGFYKLFFTAQNGCSEYPDTLQTEIMVDTDGKEVYTGRYIQVFQNAEDALDMLSSSKSCIDANDTIVFVDRNERLWFDEEPSYSFSGTEINKGITYTPDSNWYEITEITYHKGLTTSSDGTDGSDSVVVKAVFAKVGEFMLSFYRHTPSCDSISSGFNLTIGGAPTFAVQDTVYKNILGRAEFIVFEDGSAFDHCGAFSYAFPDFTNAIDSNYMEIDSISFELIKGGNSTIVKEKPDGITGSFDFDSVGNTPSYIKLRARNYCGWSEADSVKFFTRTLPEAEIWRAGIEDNDTICEKTAYTYTIEGTLPENHTDWFRFSIPVNFSGERIMNDGQYRIFNESSTFRFDFVTDSIYEDFIIVNADAPACQDTVYSINNTVAIPYVGVPYDSILYCEGTTELDIESILQYPSFSRASWNFAGNTEFTADNALPADLVPTSNSYDTLAIMISNGGICYLRDTIFFFPLTAPQLTLSEEELEFCLYDRAQTVYVTDYISASNEGHDGVKITVYWEESGNEFTLYKTNNPYFTGSHYLKPGDIYDKAHFIYEIRNDSITSEASNCTTRDSIVLRFFKPKLTIFEADTFNYVSGNPYEFSSNKNKPSSNIDTTGLQYDSYLWTVVEGSGTISRNNPATDSIWDWEYIYHTTGDLNRDSLVFELKAETRCGEELKDTLIVYIAKSYLHAFEDTICNNTVDYSLWGSGRVSGDFIDTASLEWTILNTNGGGKDWGNITPATGGSAQYFMASNNGLVSGDLLKIEVKGRYNAQSVYAKDTIELYINSAPYHSSSLSITDTLITHDGKIILGNIKALAFYNAADTFFISPSSGMSASGSLLQFNNPNQSAGTNQTGTGRILVQGLPGCENDTTSVLPFIHPVKNTTEFYTNISLCANDSITLADKYLMLGKDQYTHIEWKKVSGIGGFNADSTKFGSGSTSDHDSVKLKITAYKSYHTYDSLYYARGREYSASKSIPVFAKSVISVGLTDKSDSICSLETVYLPADWSDVLSVTPTDYFDSLRVNGRKLGEIPTNKAIGAVDTLLVTVETGNCWTDVNDSIFIYRLSALYTGDFTTPNICDQGRSATVDTTGFSIHTGTKYYWTSEGVELDTEGKGLCPTYKAPAVHNGSGRIRLHIYVGDKCEDIIEKDISIFTSPTVDFNFPVKSIWQVALGEELTFTRTSPTSNISVSDWEIQGTAAGSGATLTHQFNTEENTNISLIIETNDGCRDTTTYEIKVVPPPVVNISAVVDSCTGSVTLGNTSAYKSAVIHRWDFSHGPLAGGEPTYSDDSLPGTIMYDRVYKDTTFHIYLTLGNAADTVTGSVEVTLLSKLKTDISLAPEKDGCSEITRYINNITIGEPDSIIIDWGDGGAKEVLYDNLKRIPHKYENTSTGIKRYEIVLKAENSCEHASDTVKIAIHPKSAIPIIELSNEKSEYLKTCYDTPIGFLNSSVGFGGSAYRATWYFGDDQTAIVTDIKDTLIEHSFSEPGEYIIRLKVEDRCNTDTTSIPLTVKGSRDLSISVPEELYCEQQNIAMSAVTETAFTNFKWTFGDGQTDKSGKRNVTHKYAYNATPWYLGLSAVFEGCETEATLVPISIKRSPQARISAKNFSNTGNCSVLTVDFDGYNDNADVYNPNIFWDFGNGETATSWLDQSATYSIDPNEGTRKDSTFYVTMVVTSQEGCSDTAEIKKITVNYSPAPEFTIDQHLFCTTDGKLTVDITNITRFKELHSYEWYKNDNDRPFSISPNPGSIDFEGIGELSIKLVATHKENFCKAENMVTFISSESVKAAFDFSTGNVCESAPVTVLPSVTPGVTFKWKMGDGSAAFETTDQFDYTYPEVGNYVIEVIATNGDMCADTLAKEIVVYPIPTAGFTWEKDFSIVEGYPENINLPAIENGGVRFTNESYIWNDQWGDELSYTWNFGDNTNVSHEKDPRHEYKKSGSFDATLLIASAYGCTDSMTTNITLDHIKGLYVPTAFAPSMSDQGVALFLPKGVSLSSYSLEIYDQWGKFLWSTTLLTEDGQPVEGWDGKFEGTEMPKGVYIWRINAVFANGEVWSKNGKISGTFTLIR